MKDLPHHIKKLNRRVVRSVHREELQEEAYDLSLPSPPSPPRSKRQIKKQAKIARRKEEEARAPVPLTPEEKNRELRVRNPVVDPRINAEPRFTKPPKKTPRI